MKRFALAFVVITLAIGTSAALGFVPFSRPSDKAMDEALVAQLKSSARLAYGVAKVIDGDTFVVKVASGKATIRVLGINTPETVDPRKSVQCYGPEASARGHALLDHQRVSLELDPKADSLDIYGRVLAYVTLPSGASYNEEMISEGYAQEYTFKKVYSRRVRFRQAQTAARSAGLGLWSSTACAGKLIPRATS